MILHHSPRSKTEEKASFSNFENPLFIGEDPRVIRQMLCYGEMLATKKYGDQFGETALLTDANRNATITALVDCELMVFHKSSLDLIKSSYSKDMQEKRAFIVSQIPVIGTINNVVLVTKLLEYFYLTTFKKGDHITVEGKPGNTFYLVMDGEVLISKYILVPQLIKNQQLIYKSTNVSLSVVQGSCVVGEECLGETATYSYTITVRSALLKVYACKKSVSSLSDLYQVFAVLLNSYYKKEYYIVLLKDRCGAIL